MVTQAMNQASVTFDGDFYSDAGAFQHLITTISSDEWAGLVFGRVLKGESGDMVLIRFDDDSGLTIINPAKSNSLHFITTATQEEFAQAMAALTDESGLVGDVVREMTVQMMSEMH